MKKTNNQDYWPWHCTFPIIYIMLALHLQGCSNNSSLNALMADHALQMRKAYGDSMVACRDNAACQVGVTSSYFGQAGQAQFVKDDTALDYAKAFVPYAQIGLQAFGMYWIGSSNGTSGDRASTYVNGDGNTFVMGNKLTSTDNGQTSLTFTPTYTRTYDGGYNREYTNQEPIMTLEGTE